MAQINRTTKKYVQIVDNFLEGKKLVGDFINFITKVLLKFHYNINYENPLFDFYTKIVDYRKIPERALQELYFKDDFINDEYFLIASQMFNYILLAEFSSSE